jgi:hypothetical protein
LAIFKKLKKIARMTKIRPIWLPSSAIVLAQQEQTFTCLGVNGESFTFYYDDEQIVRISFKKIAQNLAQWSML